MSYSADTFVADEQPTTAKWNKLWSNDASFNDGTGIGDDAIIARHIADNVVGVGALAASAILLGYDDKTDGSFNTTSTTVVQITGLSLTFTAPGVRDVLVIGYAPELYASGTNRAVFELWNGTVGSGTKLNHTWGSGVNGTFAANGGIVMAKLSAPAAGSVTINGGLLAANAGTATLGNAATAPAFIMALAI